MTGRPVFSPTLIFYGVTTINIPNALTLTRLIISPIMLPALLVLGLPYQNPAVNMLLATLFVLMTLTDFFDGYLARRFNQETQLGRLMDPIADKILLLSALIALVAVQKIFFYWAIIFIGREFCIMGLRLIALEHHVTIAVSMLGKVKTFLLTAYITSVIINPNPSIWIVSRWNTLEFTLLTLSLLFSLWSVYRYFLTFKKTCMDRI